MILFRKFLLYGVVSSVLVYLIAVGATYNGVLTPQFRTLDLALLTLLPVVWWIARRGKVWHPVPLQGAALLWGLAIAASLAANSGDIRRIMIGIWFAGLYAVIWYILHDCLANRLLSRATLMNGFMLVGVGVVLIGLVQISAARAELVRPVSVFGNTNVLATFLLLLLPLVLVRFLGARAPVSRVLWGSYALAALLLIVLTFSRGAWLGLALGLAVMGMWYLYQRRWLSIAALRGAWREASIPIRRTALIGAFLLAGILAAGAVVIVLSLNEGTRRIDLRTWIYDTAVTMFVEKPVTGYGLFTFGEGLIRLNSIPPFEPHTHAHNLFLHVAAELGLLGLIALFVSLGLVARMVVRRAPQRDPLRWGLLGAITAFTGHHLLDFPIMMPAIMFSFLLLLAALTADDEPVQRPGGMRWVVVLGLVALLLTGWWSERLYVSYYQILQTAAATDQYHDGAEALAPIVQADRWMPVYVQQQGMLYGLSALTRPDDVQPAIAAFEQVVALEPHYAAGWANLGAMYAENGDYGRAVTAMAAAARTAPGDWNFAYRAGVYAEAQGDIPAARAFYEQALRLNTELPLMPEWDASELRQGLTLPESALIPLVQALVNGDTLAAQTQWAAIPHYGWPAYQVLELFLKLRQHDAAGATVIWEQVGGGLPEQRAWYYLGAALLARYQGQSGQAELAVVRDLILIDPFEMDFVFGANINYIQFLRLASPRQFLPQVNYWTIDPALAYVIANFDQLVLLPPA